VSTLLKRRSLKKNGTGGERRKKPLAFFLGTRDKKETEKTMSKKGGDEGKTVDYM